MLTGNMMNRVERRAFALKLAVETERRLPLPEALDVAGVVIRTAKAYEAYIAGSNHA